MFEQKLMPNMFLAVSRLTLIFVLRNSNYATGNEKVYIMILMHCTASGAPNYTWHKCRAVSAKRK